MTNLSNIDDHIHSVTNFKELISKPFYGELNAICWKRNLAGDFSELIKQLELNADIAELSGEELIELQLSEKGQLAREFILDDMKELKAHGASPTLNLIRCYERDDVYPYFPTDVYSFHVDRSPIPTDTFLCTYHGESSEILPNSQGIKKVLVPEIRNELAKLYDGVEEGFESFLSEYFFDLHYQAKPSAHTISLGQGNLWKLAVDHPGSIVSPCIHRAPREKDGKTRLLMIC